MSKYFRNNEKESRSMFLVSPHIIVSSEIKMGIVAPDSAANAGEQLEMYDEKCGRWVWAGGCGFSDRHTADGELCECTEILDTLYSNWNYGGVLRESFSVAWTYNYERDVFSCDYEIAEYRYRKKEALDLVWIMCA